MTERDDGAAPAAHPKGDPFDEIRRLIAEGEYESALSLCQDLARDPDLQTDALSFIAVIAYHVKGYGRAIGLLERAMGRPDASNDLPEILAVLYSLAGQLEKALFYGKLSAIMEPDNRILPALGPDFPEFATSFLNIQSAPLVARGKALLRQGATALAIEALLEHLSLQPTDEEGLDVLTGAYLRNNQPRPAIDLLRGLRAQAPGNPAYATRLGRALTLVGDLAEADASHQLACDLAASDDPAPFAARLADLAYHGRNAQPAADEAHAALCRALAALAAEVEAPARQPRGDGRLRVAYLAHGAAPADLMMAASAAKLHSRDAFEVYGYGAGSLASSANIGLRGCFDEWRDIDGLDVFTVAAIVQGDEVDILVDLGGLRGDFLPVLALRAAPVQVAWFGHPPGRPVLGVDHVLAGPAGAKSEKAWPLPVAPFLFTLPPDGGAARQGGNGGSITFAADATPAEVNPDLALQWARILNRVPDSALILRDHDFREDQTLDRLIGLFGTLGIAHRVDVVDEADPQAFFAQADIALAPFPVASPHSLAASLAAGTPVVAMAEAKTVAGVVATDLASLGIDERLTVADRDGYVEAAVALAGQAAELPALRGRVLDRLQSSSACRPRALAAALDDAFASMARMPR